MALFIDFVAGPAVGKSTLAALTFGELKMHREIAEWATEVAKELVWAKKFTVLDNQHEVSRQQYESFKSKADKVDFVVTDGSLIHALYYNRANPNNVCDVEKTERDILKWHREFNHLVIYLEREPSVPYEQIGRIQNEKEAHVVDKELLEIMKKHNIDFIRMPANRDTISNVVVLALERKKVLTQSSQKMLLPKSIQMWIDIIRQNKTQCLHLPINLDQEIVAVLLEQNYVIEEKTDSGLKYIQAKPSTSQIQI